MKIRKKQLTEAIYIYFLLFMGLFRGYIEINVIWNGGIILLTLLLFFMSKKIQKAFRRDVRAIILILLLSIFTFLNVIETGDTSYLVYNLIQIIRPILILYTVYIISMEEKNIIFEVLQNSFVLLNCMWVLNLIILGFQVAGTGFMIKASWLESNNYYADNCTGLFGGSATHIVALFTIFITIYNLEICKTKFSVVWKRKLIYMYTLLTLLLMIFYSTLNDNTAMFVLLPVFLVVYYIHRLKVINENLNYKTLKIVKYLIFLAVIIIILPFIPGVEDFFNNIVLDKISGILNTQNTNQFGSVERLAIAEYALENGFGWKFGKGIGTWNLMGDNYSGFVHFGLSSVGSFIYLLGIWGYLIICFIYTHFLSNMNTKADKTYYILTFILVILISSFTMFFTSTHALIWIVFTFIIINRRKINI